MQTACQVNNQRCNVEYKRDQEQIGTAVLQSCQGQTHYDQKYTVCMSHYLQLIRVRDLEL